MRHILLLATIIALLSVPLSSRGYSDDVADKAMRDAITKGQEIESKGNVVRCVAFGPDGLWAILYGHSGFWISDGQSKAYEDLNSLNKSGETVRWLAFTPSGGHLILHGQNGYTGRSVPDDLGPALKAVGNHQIKCVNFTPNGGWAILFGRNGTRTQRVPQECADALRELNQKNVDLNSISFAGERGWVIVYDQYGYTCRGVSTELVDGLAKVNRERRTIACVSPTSDGGNFLLVNYDRQILPSHPGGALTMDQLSEIMNETHRRHNEFLQSLPLEQRIPLLKQNWESSREMMRSLDELARPAK